MAIVEVSRAANEKPRDASPFDMFDRPKDFACFFRKIAVSGPRYAC
jgi:hypothetical protein